MEKNNFVLRNVKGTNDFAPEEQAVRNQIIDILKDNFVKYGYMRGSETVDYVQSIRQRYQHYCGVRSVSAGNSVPQKSQNAKHRSKYSL